MSLLLTTLALGLVAATAGAPTCPPPGFASIAAFNLTTYISAAWFVQAQAPNSYQPASALFCVRAEYRKDPRTPGRLQVFNQARRGSVTGAPQTMPGTSQLLAAQVVDASRGKLKVGPPFLPPALFGPYWVIATVPDSTGGYAGAVISGGPPTKATAGGCVNRGSGLPGVGGGEGLWLFTRSAVPDSSLVDQLRGIAASKNFDTSVLVTVPQKGCVYSAFPTGSG